MVYPPPAQKTDATDATPSPTEHPARHNGNGAAINDIVAELGADPSGPEANVQARLEAILRGVVGLRRKAGAWSSPGIVPAAIGTVVDTLYLQPMILAEPVPIDRLSINISTASAAGGRIQPCFYTDTGNYWPGSPIVTGDLPFDVAGAPEAVVAATLPRGIVWAGAKVATAAGQVTGGFGTNHHGIWISKPTTHYQGTIFLATAVFPDPFPAAATGIVNAVPRVLFRMA